MDSLLAADTALLAAKDEKGLGAYTAAKYSGRNEIAALLLEKGVELDVFAACMAGAQGSGAGVDRRRIPGLLNAYSQDGWTPLHLACFFGQPGRCRGVDCATERTCRPIAQSDAEHAASCGRRRTE